MNTEAARRRQRLADRAVGQRERLAGHLRAPAEPGHRIVALEEARFLHRQAVLARRLRQVAGVLDARLQLLRPRGDLLIRALLLQRVLDLRPHFVERRVAAGLLSSTLMMWKPNCDFTRSLIWPGAIANAAVSNSGTMRPRPKKSRSPP